MIADLHSELLVERASGTVTQTASQAIPQSTTTYHEVSPRQNAVAGHEANALTLAEHRCLFDGRAAQPSDATVKKALLRLCVRKGVRLDLSGVIGRTGISWSRPAGGMVTSQLVV
jgi:hypothetical protein